MQRVSWNNQPAGILIVEAVLSIALFVLFAAGAVYFLTAGLLTSQTAMGSATAAAYVQEGIEAVQSIDRAAWNQLADSPDSTYGLELDGNIWALSADPDNPNGDTNYTRTITISDAYRDSGGNPTDTPYTQDYCVSRMERTTSSSAVHGRQRICDGLGCS